MTARERGVQLQRSGDRVRRECFCVCVCVMLHHALHTCSQRKPQPKPKTPRRTPCGSLVLDPHRPSPARCAHIAHRGRGARRGPAAACQDVN